MSRWDILQRETRQALETESPRLKSNPNDTGAGVSVGRGPSDTTSTKDSEKRPRPDAFRAQHNRQPAGRDVDRTRTYPLREREMQALRDIGTFRTVDVQDLARFAYAGNDRAMNYDLGELRSHGLVEEKVVVRAHREPRRVVALTEKGHRILRKASGLRKDQAVYHGFVKSREIDHDADLYKVYQEAAEAIRREGGKPVRVRLDFELKAAIQRQRYAARNLSEEDQTKRLAAFAEEYGLRMSGPRIHVPDVQIEYETRDGELERTNLELVSENYRTEGIRSKAESGFALYARSGDTARIRRALQDTHAIERILSI